MMTRSRVFAGLLLLLACPIAADPAAAGLKWYRGNLHTHTKISDGNTSPGAVAQWYRDNDYDFLSITDHNKLADAELLPPNCRRERTRRSPSHSF